MNQHDATRRPQSRYAAGTIEVHLLDDTECAPQQLEMPLAPESTVDAILNERGARYGKFINHARITQTLKFIIQGELATNDKVLDDDQQEALDMICHKIARIVNGDSNYLDNWVDIAGYAMLVADRLDGVER